MHLWFRLYLLLYFSSVTSKTCTLAPFSLLSFKEMVLGKLHICTTSWRLLPRLCILETFISTKLPWSFSPCYSCYTTYNGSFYEPYSILTGDPIGLTPSIAKSYADPQYPQTPSTYYWSYKNTTLTNIFKMCKNWLIAIKKCSIVFCSALWYWMLELNTTALFMRNPILP